MRFWAININWVTINTEKLAGEEMRTSSVCIRLLALYHFICILFKREDGPFDEFIIKNIYIGNFIYLKQYGVPT